MFESIYQQKYGAAEGEHGLQKVAELKKKASICSKISFLKISLKVIELQGFVFMFSQFHVWRQGCMLQVN